MFEVDIEKKILCGKSRRKVEAILMLLNGVNKISDSEYSFRVVINSRLMNHERTLKACTEFDCVNTAMAFFRQSLRYLQKDQPILKFYEEVHGGELLELTIDEIFSTQDCVPEDLQIGYEWAMKNGYQG